MRASYNRIPMDIYGPLNMGILRGCSRVGTGLKGGVPFGAPTTEFPKTSGLRVEDLMLGHCS